MPSGCRYALAPRCLWGSMTSGTLSMCEAAQGLQPDVVRVRHWAASARPPLSGTAVPPKSKGQNHGCHPNDGSPGAPGAESGPPPMSPKYGVAMSLTEIGTALA